MPAPRTLEDTAAAFADPSRPPHELAADQSDKTHEAHFVKFGITLHDHADFEKKSAQVREMLFTTPGLGDKFGGAILFEDTCAQRDAQGTLLTDRLIASNVVPIVKACGLDKKTGLIPEADLEKLPAFMRRIVHEMHLCTMKIRNTVTPASGQFVLPAAEQFARIQHMAAQEGVMVFHEPELIIDNPGTLEQNITLYTQFFRHLYDRIDQNGDSAHPYAIKMSPVAPGRKSGVPLDPKACADGFFQVMADTGTPRDRFVVKLSGGYTPAESRMLLQAEAAKNRALPPGQQRHIGTSFSRVNLQRPYTQTFPASGGVDTPAGQEAILMEGRKNQAAMEGHYTPALEEAEDMATLEMLIAGNS